MADTNGQFVVPSSMSFSGNLAQNWKLWYQKFTIFMLATQKDNLDQMTKTGILLNHIGTEGLRIYNTFSFVDHDATNYDLVVQKFKDYCESQKNIIYERFRFYKCVQKPEQTFDQFLTELKSLASSCDFADLDEMVRDRVVMGIDNSQMQEILLRESNLTLQKATDLCRVTEIAKIQHQEMEDKSCVLTIQEEVKKPQKWSKFSKRQEHRKPFK
uniref:Uncharacterized protein n=1 Tax=Schizaphis graminum TaxID=13262 RepID=A0A2S2PKD8_SCHGA